ncbi:MAG: DNA repair protein RecO [Thermodesulfobacteriota bacterium]
MGQPFASDALVLRILGHGESDIIATLFSPVHGRLSCIAKGAKRSRKRFVNKLELFSRLQLLLAPTRSGLLRLDSAELVDPYPGLRSGPLAYAAASVLAEAMLHWSRENDGDQYLFELCDWAFGRISHNLRIPETLLFALMKLYSRQGFRPRLDRCGNCGKAVSGRALFLPGQHGLACPGCHPRPGGASGLSLSAETPKALELAINLPVGKLDRVRLSAAALDEGLLLARRYGNFLLQRDIRSWEVLEAVRAGNWANSSSGGGSARRNGEH